jgi:hypothetical protein
MPEQNGMREQAVPETTTDVTPSVPVTAEGALAAGESTAGPADVAPARTESSAELGDDLLALANTMAIEAQQFLTTLTEVAAGANPDAAVPLALLAVSDLLAAGSRLGAIVDVVPDEQFEPDDGPDPDLDPLRTGLVNLFADLDDYVLAADPLLSTSLSQGSLSGDLASVSQALSQGLVHYRAGHVVEALWWWQFSYVAFWGDAAANALRVLLSVLAHLRLDVDDEVAADAEFDALHR